jgi:hypothetical protein
VSVFISPPTRKKTAIADGKNFLDVIDFISFQEFHEPGNVYKTSKKPPGPDPSQFRLFKNKEMYADYADLTDFAENHSY